MAAPMPIYFRRSFLVIAVVSVELVGFYGLVGLVGSVGFVGSVEFVEPVVFCKSIANV